MHSLMSILQNWPVNPGRQTQSKEPFVLRQVEPSRQGEIISHSLMSFSQRSPVKDGGQRHSKTPIVSVSRHTPSLRHISAEQSRLSISHRSPDVPITHSQEKLFGLFLH